MSLKEKLKESIDRFSWAQMVSNSDGKTSSSGFCGVVISLTGCLTFLFGTFFTHTETLTQSVVVITLGAGLLGYRKSRPNEEASTNTPSSPEISHHGGEPVEEGKEDYHGPIGFKIQSKTPPAIINEDGEISPRNNK